MITTVNISLPKSMYEDAKRAAQRWGYASLSELIRDLLRRQIYPETNKVVRQVSKRGKATS